ncbi:MAG TPA: hypothetical protein VGF19_12725 [Candidatus Acidoferrum sp.]|jgi:hypothetical protein
MKAGGSISIWFFVGLSLLVNGILILGAGIFDLVHPPEAQVVLYNLHAGIWWGGLMTVVGAIYCFYFLPGKARKQ